MSVQPINLVAYGLTNALQNVFPFPIVSLRAPTTADKAQIGTVWVYKTTNTAYVLTSIVNNSATWSSVSGGAGDFASLTVTPGPISITGTTTINTAGAATTTIGTGGTGVVNIGNATGNTNITGSLFTSGPIQTTNGAISSGNTAVAVTGPQFATLKSRTGGVITSGDSLGSLVFTGFDGTNYITGGAITSTNSGTVAANRVAGDLTFFTHPDAAGATVARMNIGIAGNVTVNAPDAGVGLTVTAGGIVATAGNITATNGNIVLSTAGTYISLPGPVFIYSGAGAPDGGLALHVGDMYINTTAASATTRAYIATAAGTWTNFTCAG